MIYKKHILTLICLKKNYLSFQAILKNKHFNKKRRVYHIHLKKTGGTSINNSFLSLIDKEPNKLYNKLMSQNDLRLIHNNWVLCAFNQLLISLGSFHYAWSHKPFHKLYLPVNTYKITCLRDPYERIFSRYKQLTVLYRNGNPERTDGNFLYEYSFLGNSFEDYINNLPKKELCYQLYMFSQSLNVNEALESLKKVDFILDTSTIYNDMKELSEILGVKLEPLHVRKVGKTLDKRNKEKFKSVEKLLYPEVKFYKKAKELKKSIQIN